MSAYFFGCQGTVVERDLVEAPLEVREVVVAPAEEELRVAFRIGTPSLPSISGLGLPLR